jgi:hypothetical protein
MPRKYLRPLAVGKTIVQFWILAAKIKPKKIKIKRKTVGLQVGLATVCISVHENSYRKTIWLL